MTFGTLSSVCRTEAHRSASALCPGHPSGAEGQYPAGDAAGTDTSEAAAERISRLQPMTERTSGAGKGTPVLEASSREGTTARRAAGGCSDPRISGRRREHPVARRARQECRQQYGWGPLRSNVGAQLVLRPGGEVFGLFRAPLRASAIRQPCASAPSRGWSK